MLPLVIFGTEGVLLPESVFLSRVVLQGVVAYVTNRLMLNTCCFSLFDSVCVWLVKLCLGNRAVSMVNSVVDWQLGSV
jgi:hypothetical protein